MHFCTDEVQAIITVVSNSTNLWPWLGNLISKFRKV